MSIINSFSRLVLALVLMVAAIGCTHSRVEKSSQNQWAASKNRSAQVAVQGDYEHIASTITTLHDLDLHVIGKSSEKSDHNPDFHVLYSPPAKIKDPVTLEVSYSIPTVEFSAGWGIFTGGYPVGQTRRVRAVGIGTSFVLQVQSNQDLFINLSSSTHSVQVDALLGRKDSAVFQPGQYTYVDDSGRISVSQLSSAPGDVQKTAQDAEAAIAGR